MSLHSLTKAVKSSLEMSEAALKAAEEAVAAAKIAKIHAQAAFSAVKIALEVDERKKEKEERCGNCKKKMSLCLHEQSLVESFKNPEGMRVQASGDSWSSKFLGKTGTIVSTKQTKVHNFVNVLWDREEKAEQYTFLSKMEPKFIIHCKSKSPSKVPEPLKKSQAVTSEVVEISTDAKSETCSNCKQSPCFNGRFLTSYRADYFGIMVKHVDFHKNKIGTVVEFLNGIFKVNWSKTIASRKMTISSKSKSYNILSSAKGDQIGHYQLKFYCEQEKDSSTEVVSVAMDSGSRSIETYEDINLHFVDKSFIGSQVRYVGDDPDYYGRVGIVEAVDQGLISVNWFGDTNNPTQFPIFVTHSLPGLVRFQFKLVKHVVNESFEDNDEVPQEKIVNKDSNCQNCLASPCLNGQYLMYPSQVVSGMKVKYVGVTKSDLFGQIGTFSVRSNRFLFLDIDGSEKYEPLVRTLGVTTGELQFQIHCMSSEGETSNENDFEANCNNEKVDDFCQALSTNPGSEFLKPKDFAKLLSSMLKEFASDKEVSQNATEDFVEKVEEKSDGIQVGDSGSFDLAEIDKFGKLEAILKDISKTKLTSHATLSLNDTEEDIFVDAHEERISDNEDIDDDTEIEVTPEPETPQPEIVTETKLDKCNNCKASPCLHGRYLTINFITDDIDGT